MEQPDWSALVLPATHLNNRLPGVFDPGRVTNSYKFFWFLALLDFVEEDRDYRVSIGELVRKMVVRVWYPVCFFRLNFGLQDQLARAVDLLKDLGGLAESASEDEVKAALEALAGVGELRKALRDLGRFVPFRLLSPWFAGELKGLSGTKHHRLTVELAQRYAHDPARMPLYRFEGERNEFVRVNYEWYWYLRDHAEILRQFTYWHLTAFLQRRNPHTPNVQAKLFRPLTRRLGPARKLWQGFLEAHPGTACIFSGEGLAEFSLDHFLPWSFVAHDQLWNLLPTPQPVNSSKGNRLPGKEFVAPFARLQHQFVHHLLASDRKRDLEDYAGFFHAAPKELAGWGPGAFGERMSNLILPQLTVARNMGFVGW